MPNLLHIRSSANLQSSTSRQLGADLTAALRARHADLSVITRDLAAQPVPHIGPSFVANLRLPEPDKDALAFSDQLTDELLAADILVIESAMYNFTITSTLKAWFDHIIRAGRTFSYADGTPRGLAQGKVAYLVLSRGAKYEDPALKALDFQEPYLRAVLNWIGITDLQVIHVEGTAFGPEVVQQALNVARHQIPELVA